MALNRPSEGYRRSKTEWRDYQLCPSVLTFGLGPDTGDVASGLLYTLFLSESTSRLSSDVLRSCTDGAGELMALSDGRRGAKKPRLEKGEKSILDKLMFLISALFCY